MQIPFLDATKGNPALAEKTQAGIWIAEHLPGRDAHETTSCVGSSLHTL
jgi:hypothetical protein